MNILPLVCGFLIVFAILSATFVRNHHSVILTERSIASASLTQRALLNAIEKKQFSKAPNISTPIDSLKGKIKNPLHLRSITPPVEYAKLNISTLFENSINPKANPIYKVASRLIASLYSHTPIFKNASVQKLEEKILDAIIQKGISLKTSTSLNELFPDDPALKEIYYKMLKGTNSCKIAENIGTPRLSDFFSCSKQKQENTLYFAFASKPLLEALFDQEIALKIISLEKMNIQNKNPPYSLGKNELQTLLLNTSSHQLSLSLFEPYLNYGKQIPAKKTIARVDSSTGLMFRKKIN